MRVFARFCQIMKKKKRNSLTSSQFKECIMRTIETTVFAFDELPEEAKEKAIEKMREITEYSWFSECKDSLRDFCSGFGVKVTDYELSNCYRAFIATDATAKHFRGVKLSSFDREAMPTGFCFDSDLRYAFYDEFKKTGDAHHAFETAIETFLSAVRKDIDWCFSDEAIVENIRANDYEFTEEGGLI
jgi:hypothetical protein